MLALMAAGLAAEVVAWRLVVDRSRSVWAVMSVAFGALGVAAVGTGLPEVSAALSPPVAALAGICFGIALYLATKAFLKIARGWRAFHRQSTQIYERRGNLSLPMALFLAAGVMVTGEELFWRGLFQRELTGSLGEGSGAVITWVAYVAANLASGSLPIIAGAVVGGAVWTGLGAWTDGVLASLLCHGVWTALMLAFPVVRPSEPAGSSR